MFGQSYSMLPETYDSIQILGENFKELYETLKSYNEKLLEVLKRDIHLIT